MAKKNAKRKAEIEENMTPTRGILKKSHKRRAIETKKKRKKGLNLQIISLKLFLLM